MTLTNAIQNMTIKIATVLADNKPTIYLYGSVVLNDFKFGWSDIDILVLTEHEISEQQADILVKLRQTLQKRYPNNSYLQLFEGSMLSVDAFLNGKTERTIYWGTNNQRITDGYKMDSFGMAELLDSGSLLLGNDIRYKMTYPTYAKMRDDISNHVQAARKYGIVVGWLLDIARGIYTLRTGKIIAKTAAGEWALENNLCPDVEAMQQAIQNRNKARTSPQSSVSNAVIQKFADIIDSEFANTIQRFAESELRRMKIAYNKISLIRNKDGISVWRIITYNDSYVMKCFDKPEYRREIDNYQVLKSIDVPTLRIIAYTESSLVMEDIDGSNYRLGTIEDINDPIISKKIALWYKTLHQNGRKFVNTHDFADECSLLTLENLKVIKETTNTIELPVWQIIEEYFEQICSVVMKLPRTLVYTDFHFTNLAVAKDSSSALIFDYNFFFKSYAYSDIRNVCGNFYNDKAKVAFLSAYGAIDEHEITVDDVVSVLLALNTACQRTILPNWAKPLLEKVKDGRLQLAVERLLKV